jgi:putative autotransporter adhesin-like protein
MKRDSLHERRYLLWAFAISAVVSALVGCGPGGVTGSGPTKTEPRSVGSFTGVEVSNGIGLTLEVGGAQAVEVTAQENILPLITTTVEGGVLKIRGAESFTTSAGVSVTATVPALAGISVSGGSKTSIVGVAADRLDIDLSGGATLVATGSATDVTLVSTGGSRADLKALTANTMTVNLSGGSTATLNVSGQITGSASGGAAATVTGGATMGVQTSGGASVSDD